MIKEDIRQLLAEAIERAQRNGALPAVPVPEINLDHPPDEQFGDYASSIALKLKRAAGMAPMAIAGAISANLELPRSISLVQVAAPGFINFHLSTEWLQEQVEAVLRAGEQHGQIPLGKGERVQVEFVSGNPTGPLHIGSGRNGALGDSLARVLRAAGYDVQREYYINDAGTQAERLSASVYARYAQLLGREVEFPQDGYPGEYVVDLARALVEAQGDRFLHLPQEEATREVGRLASERVLAWIREDLAAMNVAYDRWFSERSLYESGLFTQVLQLLRSRGYVAEREGAVWFTSSDLGHEKDEVLVRRNGQPTYFASDIAYHYEKFVQRTFARVIDVWGADHQGQVPRLKAALKALDIDPDRLTVILYQLVNVVREGKPVRMGKRTGTYVTLREVLDEVGPDPIRYFLVARSPEATMDFDLDLAKKQSDENPVFYVQYAHARTASILRYAGELDYRVGDVALLQAEPELALIRKMVQLPELVEIAAQGLAPHHLPFYAQDIARVFHSFYTQCRVVSEDVALSRARLKLVAACKLVLANTLHLIGVSAPEEMRRPTDSSAEEADLS
ncbi:MAG: arginine--tRNA ligase [Chloroflexi bacterium]|nr:arginine--tRNA ligase [Chloroflexota bacterium]